MSSKSINYQFKKKLNSTLGGEAHSYCYQCGACVGDCPAAMYSVDFNPREILLQALLGDEEALTKEDSPMPHLRSIKSWKALRPPVEQCGSPPYLTEGEKSWA